MGNLRPVPPVLRIMAVFSRHDAAFDWAKERACQHWGPVLLESLPFAFQETSYYEASMGAELRKQFWAFAELADPAGLADWKNSTNAWEEELAAGKTFPEERPVNLDPGYLDRGKLVLASTKDHAHRIYLRDGIYAETTLYYMHRQWRPREWTFPDYRRADYHEFFETCRAQYADLLVRAT